MTSNRVRSSARGFTLLEIMIVLAIVGAVLAMGAPKLFNSGTAARSAIRKIAIMTREIRNTARLTGLHDANRDQAHRRQGPTVVFD